MVCWTITNKIGSVQVHQLALNLVDARYVGALSGKNDVFEMQGLSQLNKWRVW